MIRNLLIIVVLTILPSFAMAEVWYCGPLKTVEVFSARQTEGVSSDKLVMNVGEKKLKSKRNWDAWNSDGPIASLQMTQSD